MIWLANLVTIGGYEYHRAKAERLFEDLETEKAKTDKLSGLLIQKREDLSYVGDELRDARITARNSEARSVKCQKECDATREALDATEVEAHDRLIRISELTAKGDAWLQEIAGLKGDRDAWKQSYDKLLIRADAWFQEIIELKGDRDAWEQSYGELNFTNKRQERAVTRLGDRIKVLESDKKTLNNAANNLLAERNELRDALEKTRSELTKAKVNDRRGPGGRFIGRQG